MKLNYCRLNKLSKKSGKIVPKKVKRYKKKKMMSGWMSKKMSRIGRIWRRKKARIQINLSIKLSRSQIIRMNLKKANLKIRNRRALRR